MIAKLSHELRYREKINHQFSTDIHEKISKNARINKKRQLEIRKFVSDKKCEYTIGILLR